MTPPADFNPDSPHTQQALRLLAEEAARAGAEIAREFFGTTYGVDLKADCSEVSEADEAAQVAIIAKLRATRPQDAFLAEETLDLSPAPPSPDNDTLCWVIDPIDGTRNFVRHIPLYSCSVAAMLNGTPLVGAVYDVPRDVMYSASRDGGLFVNGDLKRPGRVAVSDQQTFSEKLLVALPSSPQGVSADISHAWFDKYVCRILGSTALHLALVASGDISGTVADNPRLWDIAAGWVLVHAVGGRMVSPDGKEIFPLDIAAYQNQELPILAANAEACGELLPR